MLQCGVFFLSRCGGHHPYQWKKSVGCYIYAMEQEDDLDLLGTTTSDLTTTPIAQQIITKA